MLLDIGAPVESLVMLGEPPLNILRFVRVTVGPNLLVKMAVRMTAEGAFASAEATLWVVPDGPAWAWKVEVGRELWAGYASVECPLGAVRPAVLAHAGGRGAAAGDAGAQQPQRERGAERAGCDGGRPGRR